MCCKIVKLAQNSKFYKILHVGGGLNIDYKEMETMLILLRQQIT